MYFRSAELPSFAVIDLGKEIRGFSGFDVMRNLLKVMRQNHGMSILNYGDNVGLSHVMVRGNPNANPEDVSVCLYITADLMVS